METVKSARDRVAFVGMMVTRLGFVFALLLGMGLMFGYAIENREQLLALHLVAGLMVLGGIWATTIRFAMLKRSGMNVLWAGATLAFVGAALGLASMMGLGAGIIHLLLMLATVGLAEAGAARVNRSAQ